MPHPRHSTQFICGVPLASEVCSAITAFRPRLVDEAAAHFAKEVTARAEPSSANRAKALLFAACRLGEFSESVGLGLSHEVALKDSVIERCSHPKTTAMSQATRRTVQPPGAPSTPRPALARPEVAAGAPNPPDHDPATGSRVPDALPAGPANRSPASRLPSPPSRAKLSYPNVKMVGRQT